MFELNKKEIQFLRNIGPTKDGRDFINMLLRLKNVAMDASNITENYGEQVEARKIVKSVITQIVDAMKSEASVNSQAVGVDDWT